MNGDTVKSKRVPPEERTSIGWHKSEDTGLHVLKPVDDLDEYLVVRQVMDGDLEGLTAAIRVDLVDGVLMIRDITYTATGPMPLVSIGARALRELRHGAPARPRW